MPAGNFKSVSVRSDTLARIEWLAAKWEKELGTRLSYSQVIDRLINLNETKK